MNIRIFLDAQELSEGISEYIYECPRDDRTNIQIYLDGQELTERVSKYMQTKEKPQIWTQIIYEGQFIRKKFIKICV